MKTINRAYYTKSTKENVVNAIVGGELWLEEAMMKYNISDRQKIISWLRKYRREKMKKPTIVSSINSDQSVRIA